MGYLFLGGPWDGRYEDVPEGIVYWTVPHLIPTSASSSAKQIVSEITSRQLEVYEALHFSVDGEAFKVFTPGRWTVKDVIVELLARYRGK